MGQAGPHTITQNTNAQRKPNAWARPKSGPASADPTGYELVNRVVRGGDPQRDASEAQGWDCPERDGSGAAPSAPAGAAEKTL